VKCHDGIGEEGESGEGRGGGAPLPAVLGVWPGAWSTNSDACCATTTTTTTTHYYYHYYHYYNNNDNNNNNYYYYYYYYCIGPTCQL